MSGYILTALLLWLSVSLAGMNPAPAPSWAPTARPQVWLSGAFGRVAGADPAMPASAAPEGQPLDTWIRKAPLSLRVDVPFEDLLAIEVVSRPLEGDDVEERLSSGATSFAGPDTAGLSVLTATITTEPHGSSQHAWLLAVPDRTGGEKALLDIPGPGALLSSSAGNRSGEPGNGCYLYLCVDVGYQPPAASLQALQVDLGETLSLRLTDGSAMSGWAGSLTPISGTEAEALEAEGRHEPAAVVRLVGLEPGVAGEWLLQVRADLDRERGWQWFLYRLVVE